MRNFTKAVLQTVLCSVPFAILFCAQTGLGAMEKIEGVDVVSGAASQISLKEPGRLGTVVVFLSAKCPCSASHEILLKELAQKNPEIRFVGVHSNSDESAEMTKEHFLPVHLPFPVVQDNKSELANEFKALKTPHAFLFNARAEKIYEGGVTDTHIASNAKKQYLADAITALKSGTQPTVTYGRTLGCVILRN